MNYKKIILATVSLFNLVFVTAQRIDSLTITPTRATIELYHTSTTGYVNSNYYISNDTCFLEVCYFDGTGATITYDSTAIPINLPTTAGNYTFKLVTSLTHSVGVCDNYFLFDSVIVDFSIPLNQPIVLSGNENFRQKNITLFPNPIKDFVSINFEGDIYKLEILNIKGSIVKSIIPKLNRQIELSELKEGIYFVKIHTNKGVFIKKIIKQ